MTAGKRECPYRHSLWPSKQHCYCTIWNGRDERRAPNVGKSENILDSEITTLNVAANYIESRYKLLNFQAYARPSAVYSCGLITQSPNEKGWGYGFSFIIIWGFYYTITRYPCGLVSNALVKIKLVSNCFQSEAQKSFLHLTFLTTAVGYSVLGLFALSAGQRSFTGCILSNWICSTEIPKPVQLKSEHKKNKNCFFGSADKSNMTVCF